MVETRRFLLGTALLVWLGSVSGAQATPDTAIAPASLCQDDPSRTPSTLTRLVCGLRDGLPKLDRETIIVSRPLAEGSAEGGRAFSERLTSLLSSATGTHNGGTLTGTLPTLAGSQPVLVLEPQLRGTLVQINATLFGKRVNLWARLRGETSQILAHAFTAQPQDTELRSYLPPVPLVRPTVRMYPTPLTQPNAIACGDIDADGALDVALANRHEIALGALTEAGFVAQRLVKLSELSPVAPVPLREPLVALWFNGTTLEASTTDRQYWLQLDAALRPLGKGANQWALAPGVCGSRTALPPDDAPFVCSSPPPLTEDTAPTFDRYVLSDDGDGLRRPAAWRDAISAEVVIRAAGHSWTLPARGSQLALADLNADGVLEVLTTSRTLNRSEDRLWLHSLPLTAKEPVLRWEVGVPTGVGAIAVCPPSAGAGRAIVFASNGHIGVAQ